MKSLRRFTVDALEVRVYADAAALAEAAASEAASCVRNACLRRGEARVILASAASQIQFLASLTVRADIDWSKVTLFHMDEYLGLPAQHPASFRRFLRDHVLSRVRPRAFYEIQGDAPEPLREIERYRALLLAAPIDLCCLGIGENGHIAFNDPPVADFQDPYVVKVVALTEPSRQQQVREGWFPNLESVPHYAYTLTIPALCRADRLLAVVPERRKAEAVRRTLCGPIGPKCPASVVRQHPNAVLFLDQDSAAFLEPR
ncbi:MAG: glucosamine-6-phosphate deaminase [Verrucomicrobiota bacterium]|nr:glucosamine-6-phosphate deaminase [Limisphaera sp.]MDW8380859.1 glucosamine-6-phosphate deaminase [Verrucomicrobiota bacterium]